MTKWLNDTYHFVEGKTRMLPQYNQWFDMTQRCTSERSRKLRPTYESSSICPEWLNYDEYLTWAVKQIGHLSLDDDGCLFQIDKDLLGSGDYNPQSCVFLPQQLNKFLTGSRGNQFVGCSLMPNGKWRVTIRDPFQSKNIHLGCFEEVEDASQAYKLKKKEFAIKLANKWKDHIEPRAFKALLEM